jgi:putative endonuclease
MEGSVYILQSQKNFSYYVGSTEDIDRRFREHNAGQTKSTRHLIPWKLVFFKVYSDIAIAKKIECKIKKLKSRRIIEKIILNQDISMDI